MLFLCTLCSPVSYVRQVSDFMISPCASWEPPVWELVWEQPLAIFISLWQMLLNPLTLVRGILSSLGLPAWFRHACFEYHAHVRLRLKLAASLGEPWTRDGGILQGCLFEHDVSCCFVLVLVQVSGCAGGCSASVVR